MKYHSWENNVCTKCGLCRELRPFKLLMAIVNHPPWNLYKYGQEYVYYSAFKKETTKRPDCI